MNQKVICLMGCVCALALLAASAHAGTPVVIFDNGAVQGTATDVTPPATGSVAIVRNTLLDPVLDDNVTNIQLDKIFDRYAMDCTGDLPLIGLPALIQVDLPSAARIGSDFFDIQISDEMVINATCTPWWDFEWIIVPMTSGLDFEILNPPDPSTSDFFEGLEGDGLQGRFFDTDGEPWPNDCLFHTLFQSAAGAPFTVRVLLPGEGPSTFLIKERPSIPEPATMALVSTAGILLLGRRRRR